MCVGAGGSNKQLLGSGCYVHGTSEMPDAPSLLLPLLSCWHHSHLPADDCEVADQQLVVMGNLHQPVVAVAVVNTAVRLGLHTGRNRREQAHVTPVACSVLNVKVKRLKGYSQAAPAAKQSICTLH